MDRAWPGTTRRPELRAAKHREDPLRSHGGDRAAVWLGAAHQLLRGECRSGGESQSGREALTVAPDTGPPWGKLGAAPAGQAFQICFVAVPEAPQKVSAVQWPPQPFQRACFKRVDGEAAKTNDLSWRPPSRVARAVGALGGDRRCVSSHGRATGDRPRCSAHPQAPGSVRPAAACCASGRSLTRSAMG